MGKKKCRKMWWSHEKPPRRQRVRFRRSASANKYSAVRQKIDGTSFASKAEARRYGVLTMLVKAGHIHDLKVHPRYKLFASNGILIGAVEMDFVYTDSAGAMHYEDVKSVATAAIALSAWKRKHFEAQYGVKVELVMNTRGR